MDDKKIWEIVQRMALDGVANEDIQAYFSRKNIDINDWLSKRDNNWNLLPQNNEQPVSQNDTRELNKPNELSDNIEVDEWDEIDRSWWWANAVKIGNILLPYGKKLLERIWKEWFKEVMNKAAYKAWEYLWWKWLLGKWANITAEWLKWLKANPSAIQMIIQWITSLWEANSDMNKWLTKNDSLSMALDFMDNFAFDLPSGAYHKIWKTNAPWETATVQEQKEQVADIKKNKKILDTYKKMGWNKFLNLMTVPWETSKAEWGYLKEEKRINDEFWGNWLNEATAQLSLYAARNWLSNDANLKKQIIDKWYKFKTVDENWKKYQTWVDKNWNTLLQSTKDINSRWRVDFRNKPEWETINI